LSGDAEAAPKTAVTLASSRLINPAAEQLAGCTALPAP
jgi:hypothetical protein